MISELNADIVTVFGVSRCNMFIVVTTIFHQSYRHIEMQGYYFVTFRQKFQLSQTKLQSSDFRPIRIVTIARKKHHQSICNRARPRDGDESNDSTTAQATTTTANTINHVKNQQTIPLKTARVMVFNEDGSQLVPARILLDNGSQLPYITEQLEKQLNLKPMRVEKVHSSSFGVTGYKT